MGQAAINNPDLDAQADLLAGEFLQRFSPEEVLAFVDSEQGGKYARYQSDPVSFGEDLLGISFTPDIQRMLQSVVDHQITVVRSATGTGKSHGAAAAASWFYKSFPNSRVYTIANPFENQKILWSELATMASTPQLFDTDRHINYQIERSAKDFITALTVPTVGTEHARESKFSGKHHEHMLFIVDEGDTVPDFVYRGVEGCMSGGRVVRLLVLFNPRYEAGRPYRLERDNEARVIELSAFNHPNVKTGENQIPGAVDRDTTVRRINTWTRVPGKEEKITDRNSFVIPDFLVGAIADKRGGGTYPPLEAGTRIVTNPAFHYMVLGQYPAESENQLISVDWIHQARQRWDEFAKKWGYRPPASATGRGVLGLDSAEFGIDNNVAVIRCGAFVHLPDPWSGVDMVATGDKGAEIYHENQCTAAYPDGIGVGAGVAPHMRRLGCNAYSIKVSEAPTTTVEEGDFRKMRDQLWWACREWLRTDPNSMLPPDEELLEELKTPTYKHVNGKIVVTEKEDLREMLRRSPDRADALCLTFADVGQRKTAGGHRREVVIEDAEGWT